MKKILWASSYHHKTFWLIVAFFLASCGKLQVDIEPDIEVNIEEADPAATASREFEPTALPPTVMAGPRPTPTPVAPMPGLVYRTGYGLWWVTAGPVKVSDRLDAQLSPSKLYTLYQDGNDIWISEIATGQSRNLTEGSGRVHCCAQWWPGRPDVIVFGSWPVDSDIGPSTGFLSAINVDGNGYTVLDAETPSNALPGLSPDGQTIAYDRAGTSWLYHWTGDREIFDPAAYGLPNLARIGGPAWSRDGRQLAWTVATQDPEWQIALAVFDLDTQSVRLLHPYKNIGRGGWFEAPAWSPDGRWLAFVASDQDQSRHGVWVVAADGSSESYLGRGAIPVWSPDGRYLTYTSLPIAGSADELVAKLVAVDSWYQIDWDLPAGAVVVDWVE